MSHPPAESRDLKTLALRCCANDRFFITCDELLSRAHPLGQIWDLRLQLLDRETDPRVVLQPGLGGVTKPAIAVGADVLDPEFAADCLWDDVRHGQLLLLDQADDAAPISPWQEH